MENQQFSNDKIDAALAAYADLTPESINAFRALGELDAAVVIRVLKATGTKPPKVGRPRGSKNRAPASKPNGAAQPQAS